MLVDKNRPPRDPNKKSRRKPQNSRFLLARKTKEIPGRIIPVVTLPCKGRAGE